MYKHNLHKQYGCVTTCTTTVNVFHIKQICHGTSLVQCEMLQCMQYTSPPPGLCSLYWRRNCKSAKRNISMKHILRGNILFARCLPNSIYSWLFLVSCSMIFACYHFLLLGPEELSYVTSLTLYIMQYLPFMTNKLYSHAHIKHFTDRHADWHPGFLSIISGLAQSPLTLSLHMSLLFLVGFSILQPFSSSSERTWTLA